MSGELHVAYDLQRPPWRDLDPETFTVTTLEAVTLGRGHPEHMNVWFLSRDEAGRPHVAGTSLRKLVTAVRFLVANPDAERELADMGRWVDW